VKQKIVPSELKRQAPLQHGFPTEQPNCVDNSSDTACGVGRVYRCHWCSFDVAGGCTALIKKSLVYHAYEKVFKELWA
jgi:hypothetical protein